MTRSVLDDLGEEVTGIAAPVTICMAITVLFVKILNPEGGSNKGVLLASLAYTEQSTDSAGTKLGGALLNAIIFVCVIAGMTFVLFILFKYRCYKLIYAYMAFALFNLFFLLTGAIGIQLLQAIGLHMDVLSFVWLLTNFSAVGIMATFFMPAPLFLKQCYLVWVGIVTAYMFTFIPEWTSWVLLVMMALYDLVAVLVPGGPLKILVELAIERNQELPALIYEARPTQRPYQRGQWRQRGASAAVAPVVPVVQGAQGSPSRVALLSDAGSHSQDELGRISPDPSQRWAQPVNGTVRGLPGPVGEGEEASTSRAPDVPPGLPPVRTSAGGGPASTSAETLGVAWQRISSAGASGGASAQGAWVEGRAGESEVGISRSGSRQRASSSAGGAEAAAAPSDALSPAAGVEAPNGHPPGSGAEAEDEEIDLPDGIKLGLGDFIFYSMLVGRAAMYDMMTVYASFLAIISGLGITLLLLAVFKKALPALPVSIALGVLFYFLTRLAIEPFLVPLSVLGLMY